MSGSLPLPGNALRYDSLFGSFLIVSAMTVATRLARRALVPSLDEQDDSAYAYRLEQQQQQQQHMLMLSAAQGAQSGIQGMIASGRKTGSGSD